MKRILAIDPGANGGFAWNDITGTRTTCIPIPETDGDKVAVIRVAARLHNPIVIIEQVGGYIGKFQTGSSMFRFGENFGFLQGVVQTLGLTMVLVTPQKWQKALGLGAKKDYDNKWKHHLKEKAQQLYPRVGGITLKTADALLILHYGIHYSQLI
jgi:hypothetical protein